MNYQKKLFITGASGFLGSALLPKLVRCKSVNVVYVLIRGNGRGTYNERLENLKQNIFSPFEISEFGSKIIAIEGDLEQEGLGISSSDLSLLETTVTHVVHIGASTDFSAPIQEARSINVVGTQRVLDLVSKIKKSNSNFVRFDYVSTAFVAGTKPGKVKEDCLDRGQSFANSYEQSKFEAEVLVRQYMSDIPTVIHRPSIVVGDSRSGYTPHFKVLYWPLLLLSKNILPFIPCNPMAMLDIVPVDFVTSGMFGILMDDHSIGRTFHLTSGLGNAVRIHGFLEDAFRQTSIERKPIVPLTVFKLICSRWGRKLMSDDFWAACEMAKVYSDYIRGTSVVFDNSSTLKFLGQLGLEGAPTWDSYKDRVFDYCIQSRWGKRKIKKEFEYRLTFGNSLPEF